MKLHEPVFLLRKLRSPRDRASNWLRIPEALSRPPASAATFSRGFRRCGRSSPFFSVFSPRPGIRGESQRRATSASRPNSFARSSTLSVARKQKRAYVVVVEEDLHVPVRIPKRGFFGKRRFPYRVRSFYPSAVKRQHASDLKLRGQEQCGAPGSNPDTVCDPHRGSGRDWPSLPIFRTPPVEFKPVKAESVSPAKRHVVSYPPSESFCVGFVPEGRDRVRVSTALSGRCGLRGAEDEYGCAEYLRAAFPLPRVFRNSLS